MSAAFETTCDGFLDRRLTICQPKHGFRSGHDSVLLAASTPAKAEHVLELGAGAGVASLCLAARVAECRVTGIEIGPELVSLANANAERNGLAARVRFVAGNVLEDNLGGARFDHVFFNPPFHPSTGQASPNEARARAMRDDDETVQRWTTRAQEMVSEGGTVTLIMRADRFEAWRACVSCAAAVLPLVPRENEAPKRIIARLTPGEAFSCRVAEPFVLHRADGKPTPQAEAVLRHGAPLAFA